MVVWLNGWVDTIMIISEKCLFAMIIFSCIPIGGWMICCSHSSWSYFDKWLKYESSKLLCKILKNMNVSSNLMLNNLQRCISFLFIFCCLNCIVWVRINCWIQACHIGVQADNFWIADNLFCSRWLQQPWNECPSSLKGKRLQRCTKSKCLKSRIVRKDSLLRNLSDFVLIYDEVDEN